MSFHETSRPPPDVPPPLPPPLAVERPAPARVDGGGPAFSIDLDVETGAGTQVLVLRFAGEIDLATLPAVRDALAAARNATSCDVVVDLAALRFCCARGFALLVDAAEHAAGTGAGFSVSGLHPQFLRIASVVWPDGAVTSHPSAADAISALRADRDHRSRSRP